MNSASKKEVIGTVEVKYIENKEVPVVHTDSGETLILRRIGMGSLRLEREFVKFNGTRMQFKGKQSGENFFAISWFVIKGA